MLRIFPQIMPPIKRMMSSQTPDVLFETINNAEIITLNRPKALNSINNSMINLLLKHLLKIENSRRLVIIKGAGNKAFCSGGDIKVVFDNVEYPRLLRKEYNVSYLIGKYKIPCISFLNGIAMGAGVSIPAQGRYRVVTEKSIIAMPETKIGFCPDVGASYFLPRLQFNLGFYLGLTGAQLKGKDIIKAGIATHYVSYKRLCELEKLLSRCTSDSEVLNLLNKFNDPTKKFPSALNVRHINYCFSAATVEEIIARLENFQNAWSIKTLEMLNQMSPGALKIVLRALQRGAQMELPDCLMMEYRIAYRAARSHDFPEGVQALLIDKDNKPQWNPKSLAEVGDDYVESYFKELPRNQELRFFDKIEIKV